MTLIPDAYSFPSTLAIVKFFLFFFFTFSVFVSQLTLITLYHMDSYLPGQLCCQGNFPLPRVVLIKTLFWQAIIFQWHNTEVSDLLLFIFC